MSKLWLGMVLLGIFGLVIGLVTMTDRRPYADGPAFTSTIGRK